MSKRDKLRRKLRNNPKGRTQQELETLVSHFGFVLDHITGSHHVFILEDAESTYRIVIPIHRGRVKPFYVKQVIEMIDKIFPEESIAEENEDD